jgi:hypothetical protein
MKIETKKLEPNGVCYTFTHSDREFELIKEIQQIKTDTSFKMERFLLQMDDAFLSQEQVAAIGHICRMCESGFPESSRKHPLSAYNWEMIPQPETV